MGAKEFCTKTAIYPDGYKECIEVKDIGTIFDYKKGKYMEFETSKANALFPDNNGKEHGKTIEKPAKYIDYVRQTEINKKSFFSFEEGKNNFNINLKSLENIIKTRTTPVLIGNDEKTLSLGTGTFFNSTSVVTAKHVLNGINLNEICIFDSYGTRLKVLRVNKHPNEDIAVIKLGTITGNTKYFGNLKTSNRIEGNLLLGGYRGDFEKGATDPYSASFGFDTDYFNKDTIKLESNNGEKGIFAAGNIEPGDSGGPVLDQSNNSLNGFAVHDHTKGKDNGEGGTFDRSETAIVPVKFLFDKYQILN